MSPKYMTKTKSVYIVTVELLINVALSPYGLHIVPAPTVSI